MKLVEKISDTLERDLSLRNLIKVLVIFAVVWLFQETSGFWLGLLSKIWAVINPFAIGFVIAYILRNPIRFGEKHGVSRKIVVPILYILITLFIVWLVWSIVPMLIDRSSEFINSIINGVNWVYSTIGSLTTEGMPSWLESFIKQGVSALSDLQAVIPNISNNIPVILTTALNVVANGIIAIVVSIFLCMEWEKFRLGVATLTRRISKKLYTCVFKVNEEESTYIHSLVMLIGIHFVEYSIVYFVVGHPNWMIMSLLTAISLIIPYIGPTVSNVIGIFTALSLPTPNIIILIVLIAVLSNTDEYVLAPIVHSHNTHVPPLWAIFSVFTGGALFGVVGVVIAIPVFLALRIVIGMYHEEVESEE